jgi:hypothetical protein
MFSQPIMQSQPFSSCFQIIYNQIRPDRHYLFLLVGGTGVATGSAPNIEDAITGPDI